MMNQIIACTAWKSSTLLHKGTNAGIVWGWRGIFTWLNYPKAATNCVSFTVCSFKTQIII